MGSLQKQQRQKYYKKQKQKRNSLKRQNHNEQAYVAPRQQGEDGAVLPADAVKILNPIQTKNIIEYRGLNGGHRGGYCPDIHFRSLSRERGGAYDAIIFEL